MSSPYPVLNNRPIDHWKVTELKEELKRRKLITKGLKDDLVKRLAEDLYFEDEQKEALLIERGNAEALCVETEIADKNVDNGIDGAVVAEPDPSLGETAGNIVDSGVTQKKKEDDVAIKVHTNDNAAALGHGDVKEGDTFVGSDSASVEANVVLRTTVVETITTISESVISEVALTGQHFPNTETQKENGNSKPYPKYEDSKPLLYGDVLMSKPKDEGIESTDSMVMPETSPLKNQVWVSLTSGSQVKSDSISPNSLSIDEKIEIKDNIISDNVKIELDIVKPEMVEPSSSNVDPVPGESHPTDVEEPKEKKTYIEGEDDSNNAANTDMNKNNQTVDVGYSEKLNLDRSSGDDSMEEDLLETRQIDSKDDYDDVVDRGEKTEIPLANEETPVDVVGGGLSLDNDINVESMNHAAVTHVNKENPIGMPAEKRKLNDQEGTGSNEPLKRQRRWNTESVKVPESRSPNLTPTTPKNAFQSTALKRNFSVSDSKSSDDAPKERVVPPSPKPPTKSLRIDHFVRPFTLKAVQELLGKTGTVAKFWMDQIKTHCFVTYSSVEEAIETRNAVYNLQWPPNGGRLLAAEFVEPQEVTLRADAPQAPAAPVKAGPTTLSAPPAAAQHVPSPRQPVPRHQPLPPPPPLPSTNLSSPREQLPPPPPLPLDPPIATLDDLFSKTKASPWIYYLPLSEKEVAAKLAAQGKKQQA